MTMSMSILGRNSLENSGIILDFNLFHLFELESREERVSATNYIVFE